MTKLQAMLFFCCSFCTAVSVAAEQKVKIGVSTALTGPAATYGLDVRDALLFANEELGEGKFELLFEDDKCEPKAAVSAAQKLTAVENVKYVLGFPCSGPLLSSAPVYERSKTVTIASCASSPKIKDAGDYIFRTTPSDAVAAKKLFNHIVEKHPSVAILSEESDYAQDFADAFMEANKQAASPLKIISESFLPGAGDFKTLLARLRQQTPGSIFLNTQTEQSFAVVLKQLAGLKWDVPVYGAYWPGSPALLKEAGALANGVEFVDTPPLAQLLNSEGESVFAKYRKKYPAPRSIESVFASTFEAFRVVTLAERSGQDPRSFLYGNRFDGIFGSYRFTSDGEIEGLSFVMKRIENGEPIVLDVAAEE